MGTGIQHSLRGEGCRGRGSPNTPELDPVPAAVLTPASGQGFKCFKAICKRAPDHRWISFEP